jgi:hypothetical protein
MKDSQEARDILLMSENNPKSNLSNTREFQDMLDLENIDSAKDLQIFIRVESPISPRSPTSNVSIDAYKRFEPKIHNAFPKREIAKRYAKRIRNPDQV